MYQWAKKVIADNPAKSPSSEIDRSARIKHYQIQRLYKTGYESFVTSFLKHWELLLWTLLKS